jgi:hypothetical protein
MFVLFPFASCDISSNDGSQSTHQLTIIRTSHNFEINQKLAVCKVRELTLLHRVGTSWRWGDGLFFEVPPLASDVLLATLHPLLVNGVTVVLKEPFLGWWSNLSGASALHD